MDIELLWKIEVWLKIITPPKMDDLRLLRTEDFSGSLASIAQFDS
jgi:hypothetical protein